MICSHELSTYYKNKSLKYKYHLLITDISYISEENYSTESLHFNIIEKHDTNYLKKINYICATTRVSMKISEL